MEAPITFELEDLNTLLDKGVAAAKAGQRDKAYGLLRAIVRRDPRNVDALLWLAGIVDDPSVSIMYLEQLLSVDPDNDAAKEGLAWARAKQLQRNRDKGRELFEPAPSRPPTAQDQPPSLPRRKSKFEVPLGALSGPAGTARTTSKARVVAVILGVLLVGFSLYSVAFSPKSSPASLPGTMVDTMAPTSEAVAMAPEVPSPAPSRNLSARGGGAEIVDPSRYSVTTVSAPAVVPSPGPSPSTSVEYTVKKGDSLWAIAQQHRVTVEEIMALNKLPDKNLSIGQKLLIPQK